MTNRDKRASTGSGDIVAESSEESPERGGSVARRVWYILSNAEGNPYSETRCATKLKIAPSVEDVDDFRAQIFQAHASELQGLTKDRLLVYRTKSDLASGSFIDPGLSINALGQSSEGALIVVVPESVKRQRTKPEEQGANLPAPDGQRLETLLPTSAKLFLSDMYFVNREGSMQALLELHFQHYLSRMKTSGGSGTLQLPLMDSLFGMGKTTFACNYLALIEKFARRCEELPDGSNLSNESPFFAKCCLALKSVKAGQSHTVVPEGIQVPICHDNEFELIHGFLGEMRRARTLYVKFNNGDLFAHETRFLNVQLRFQFALAKWGIELPDSANEFSRIIKFIPKPVFIVFDEIGQAFNQAETRIQEQRNRFLDFVTSFCTTALLDIPGVFFLLCGRSGRRDLPTVDE